MLNYNSTDPEHIKARQNVVPPSVEEIEILTSHLNSILPHYGSIIIETLQRLLHDHQHKSHFYDVVGGWEGYNKLKRNE